ncbi:MAG: diguanylate cyclase [Planctomycetota bacterium]|nr:MAG: diguanylate cyclase [Planctomycetota bacterium]
MAKIRRDDDFLENEEQEEEPFAIIEKLKNQVGITAEETYSGKYKDLMRENQGLKQLLEINREITSELELDKLLEKIMDKAIELTGAERGFLIMKEDGGFQVKIARNFEQESINKPEFKVSYSIAEEVARTGEPILTQNAMEDPRFGKYESVQGLRLCSVLCVPFKVQKNVLGVLYLDNRFKPNIFGEWEKYLLTTIAAQEAVAIENARLYQNAIIDGVTGLYTDHYFSNRLREEVHRCSLNSEGTFSLLLLDIDNFHLINDLIGYQLGNELLRKVGQLIQQKLRDIDILARIKGDEFELLLPDTPKEFAKKVAERIRESLNSSSFEIGNEKIELTMSIGLVTFPEDGKEEERLRIRADEALYKAKRSGRNRVFSFDTTDYQREQKQKEYIVKEGLDQLAFSRDSLIIMSMVNKLIQAETDFEKLVDLVASMLVEGTQANRVFIILVDKHKNLEFKAAKKEDLQQVGSPEFKTSHSIIEHVAEKGHPLLISDAMEDPDFSQYKSVVDLKLKSILCVPIKYKKKTIGVIYLDNMQGAEKFSQSDLDWVTQFAEKIATPVLHSWNTKRKQEELEEKAKRLEKSIDALAEKYSYHNIIGKSPAMEKVYQLLDKISETSHPVYIHGESGTGKELIAKAIHYNGPRKSRPFVAENCAAISESLLEAELFGYVKGAFTGADRDKKGLFEIADGGTLFLDEVGDMTIGMQKKLLRVLQEGELRRVGGKNIIPVDVRIICASNKNLKELVEKGEFREDLYYRLNVITINLPPLRDRKEDIPLLVDHFLKKIAKDEGVEPKTIHPKALELLVKYDWPGNIRELQNEISRAMVLAGDKSNITVDDLSEKIKRGPKMLLSTSYGQRTLKEILEECEREAIAQTLELTNWNKAKTARILEVSRTTLDKKIQVYNLKPES